MMKFRRYLATMYRPSYIFLTICLGTLAAAMLALALTVRAEMLAGTRGFVLTHGELLEKMLPPALFSTALALAPDAIERMKASKK